jgi:hypothetical protein
MVGPDHQGDLRLAKDGHRRVAVGGRHEHEPQGTPIDATSGLDLLEDRSLVERALVGAQQLGHVHRAATAHRQHQVRREPVHDTQPDREILRVRVR